MQIYAVTHLEVGPRLFRCGRLLTTWLFYLSSRVDLVSTSLLALGLDFTQSSFLPFLSESAEEALGTIVHPAKRFCEFEGQSLLCARPSVLHTQIPLITSSSKHQLVSPVRVGTHKKCFLHLTGYPQNSHYCQMMMLCHPQKHHSSDFYIQRTFTMVGT